MNPRVAGCRPGVNVDIIFVRYLYDMYDICTIFEVHRYFIGTIFGTIFGRISAVYRPYLGRISVVSRSYIKPRRCTDHPPLAVTAEPGKQNETKFDL